MDFSLFIMLAGGEGNPLFRPELGFFLWSAIVFTIVYFVLYKKAIKPISEALKSRTDKIHDSLTQAEQAREEMKNLKADNERILQEAKEERIQTLKTAKEDATKIVEDAKEKAKAESKKILEETKLEINNEKMAALTEVKNKVGTLSIDIAEKVLTKELKDKNDQSSYIAELINQMDLN